jgi:hypothetical protein
VKWPGSIRAEIDSPPQHHLNGSRSNIIRILPDSRAEDARRAQLLGLRTSASCQNDTPQITITCVGTYGCVKVEINAGSLRTIFSIDFG